MKKDSDKFYGLEATENPLLFRVVRVPVRSPAPNKNWYEGRFYFCMMHLEENQMMVAGGSKGTFETQDKTFVLQWDDTAPDVSQSMWIDTQGQNLKYFASSKKYGHWSKIKIWKKNENWSFGPKLKLKLWSNIQVESFAKT